MVCLEADARIHVQRGGLIRLGDAEGTTVCCHSGAVWVTLERDDRDILLEAGQEFTIDRAGLSLVCAIAGPAEVVIRHAEQTETAQPAPHASQTAASAGPARRAA
jgi:hypothetical protein